MFFICVFFFDYVFLLPRGLVLEQKGQIDKIFTSFQSKYDQVIPARFMRQALMPNSDFLNLGVDAIWLPARKMKSIGSNKKNQLVPTKKNPQS